jgi:hypothetical protein
MTTNLRTGLLSFVLTFFVAAAHAQTVNVTGKIIDIRGNAVVSASVRVKDSRLGTSSDAVGLFNLKLKARDSIIVTAVGFADTIFAVGDRNLVTIVMQSQSKVLGEAVVTGSSSTKTGLPNPQEVATEEIIADLFQDYVITSQFAVGEYHSDYLTHVGGIHMVNNWTSGFGPLNGINSGTMLPEMTHQEDTRGSRYLLKAFTPGVIIDANGHIMTDSTRLLNFDKIDGQLLIAEGGRNYLEVDKDKVIAFAFRSTDTAFVFLNVPILSKINYYILIANGPKYSAYKSVRTSLVKANYSNRGLVESGNNFDEYVDKETYFWVEGNNNAGVFELKKKSIKEAFAGEKDKVDAYFAQHKYDEIDDIFVRKLIIYLNKS